MEKTKLTNSYQIRIRYADTDQMGVVYNGNYPKFFEIGRTELMRKFGLPYIEVEAKGFMLPLLDIYVRYIKPANYDDLVDIEANLSIEKNLKIRFDYKLFVNRELISEGYSTHIFINSETKKPVRIPQFFYDNINSLNI